MPSKKKSVKELRPLTQRPSVFAKTFGKGLFERPEAINQEVNNIAFSNIMDYFDDNGNITYKHLQSLAPEKQRAIKEIIIIPQETGDNVKIVLYDKKAMLLLVARIEGIVVPVNTVQSPAPAQLMIVPPEKKSDE